MAVPASSTQTGTTTEASVAPGAAGRPIRSRAWLPEAFLLGGLLLAVLVTYRAVPEFRFVGLDDQAYVYENPRVRAGLTGEGVRWALTAFVAGNWHPLTLISHMADVSLHGLHPAGHHVGNLLLHMANTALLYLVLRRMSGARWRSATVAALFAVHPLHVESVAWVSERKDLLSTLFSLLSLLSYVTYARSRKALASIGAAIFLALGLAAKPMLVTLPLVFLLLDFWPLGRWRRPGTGERSLWRALFAEKAPFLCIVAASSTITLAAQKHMGAMVSLESRPLLDRLGNAVVSYGWYLVKAALPASLAVPYPFPQGGWPLWLVAGAGLALALASVPVLRAARSLPFLVTGWLWFLATLVPVIGIVQVGAQARADRYTYMPLTGIFIAVAWAGGGWAVTRVRRRMAAALALVALGVFSAMAAQQSRVWRDSITLFRHAIATVGESAFLCVNLGVSLMADGQFAEAVVQFEKANRHNPDDDNALYNLGIAAASLGNNELALARFSEALSKTRNPQMASRIHNHRGELLLGSDEREAVASFQRARELNPDNPTPLFHLGGWHLRAGRSSEAADHFRRTLAIQPENAWAWSNLGLAVAQLGKKDEAIAHFRAAVTLSPGLAIARYNLGSLLQERGEFAEAERQLREAIRAKPSLWQASVGLGDLLARRRDASGAIEAYQAALREQPGNRDVLQRLEALRGLPPTDRRAPSP